MVAWLDDPQQAAKSHGSWHEFNQRRQARQINLVNPSVTMGLKKC